MISSIFINTIRTFNDHSGEFKGNVTYHVVPRDLREEFFSNDNGVNEFLEEFIVNGKFEFETLDGVLLVKLMNLSLSDGNRVIDLNLDKLDGNEIYDLEERLANSNVIQGVINEEIT